MLQVSAALWAVDCEKKLAGMEEREELPRSYDALTTAPEPLYHTAESEKFGSAQESDKFG